PSDRIPGPLEPLPRYLERESRVANEKDHQPVSPLRVFFGELAIFALAERLLGGDGRTLSNGHELYLCSGRLWKSGLDWWITSPSSWKSAADFTARSLIRRRKQQAGDGPKGDPTATQSQQTVNRGGLAKLCTRLHVNYGGRG